MDHIKLALSLANIVCCSINVASEEWWLVPFTAFSAIICWPYGGK